MLQDQLHHELWQCEAWELEMYNKNLAMGSQPQLQAPLFIGSSGPSKANDAPGNVVEKPGDWSVLREDNLILREIGLVTGHLEFSKRARSESTTSHRSLSPQGDYPRGTSSVTRPSQASPEHADDGPGSRFDLFKSDIHQDQGRIKIKLMRSLEREPSPDLRAGF